MNGQNKGKCLLDQNLSHPLMLSQTVYFSSSSLRSFLCLSSGLQIKYCGKHHGSCSIGRHIVFNLDWEFTLPSLFEFSHV